MFILLRNKKIKFDLACKNSCFCSLNIAIDNVETVYFNCKLSPMTRYFLK